MCDRSRKMKKPILLIVTVDQTPETFKLAAKALGMAEFEAA
jgi:hypothetical protein